MFVGRKKEIETIQELIKRQKSIVITGREGSGKTTLLKELSVVTKGCYFELTTPKDMLNKISTFLKLNKGVVTTNVLLEKVCERITKRNETVLLIDNAESMLKAVRKMLRQLEEAGAVIICAAEDKPRKFKFRKIIELEPLSRNETKELAREYLGIDSQELILNLIYTKSFGYPGKIREVANDYLIALKVFDVNPRKEGSIHNFFLDVRPEIPERINLLPMWLLFTLGFGLLLARYFFYSWGDFQEGYLVAMFGYTSLILYRLISMKDYEK